MRNEEKKAAYERLGERLSAPGLVTPTLAEGQPDRLGMVRDIPTLTEYIGQQLAIGGEAAINAGKGLLEAKQQLKHGEWQDWLAENFGLSDRQARRLMTLAQNYGDSKRTPVSVLGQRKALALLALPESEREEFLSSTHQVNGEEKAVIDMTSRELEKAIKERDEARKAAEQAKADKKISDESRESVEQLLKTSNELAARLRSETDQAAAKVADLEKEIADLKAAPTDVAVMEVDQEKLDAARAEGEAAKAEEIATLQAELDKAKEAKKKADEKRKEAEAAAKDAQEKLEAAEKEAAKKQSETAVAANPDTAKFEVYFNQAQEVTNKLRGLLLKARGRDDQSTAEKLSKALIALSEQVRRCAE